MKTKLKIIAVTFIATTLFWWLAIVGFLWWPPTKNSGINFVGDAQRRGFHSMLYVTNSESESVTFTVAELRTNTTSSDLPQVVLLERQLPPSGDFWIGIKKTKPGNK